jgi:putative (di)nucleoside polyphosphate hydrolase
MTDPATLPYRPCAGVMLLNRKGEVFVGQRFDTTIEAWQMPQGGIDPGEDALDAAYRELWEETGVVRAAVELIAAPDEELQYDLPDDLIGKVWKGKWRGQRQRWFLFRLTAGDEAIDIATAEPEFRAWRWIAADQLPDVIVPFKRALYIRLLELFAPHLARAGS